MQKYIRVDTHQRNYTFVEMEGIFDRHFCQGILISRLIWWGSPVH